MADAHGVSCSAVLLVDVRLGRDAGKAHRIALQTLLNRANWKKFTGSAPIVSHRGACIAAP